MFSGTGLPQYLSVVCAMSRTKPITAVIAVNIRNVHSVLMRLWKKGEQSNKIKVMLADSQQ